MSEQTQLGRLRLEDVRLELPAEDQSATGDGRDGLLSTSFTRILKSYRLLTAEEEVHLAQRVEMGDREAREILYLCNQRWVLQLALKFRRRAKKLAIEDLVSYGNEGLNKTIDKFDWRKGFKFSTYATWWIRQAIGRGIANDDRTVRLPVHVSTTAVKVWSVETKLEKELEREPTPEELAEKLGWTVAQLEKFQSRMGVETSLETPIGKSDKGKDKLLVDFIQDERTPDPHVEAAKTEAADRVEAALARLPPKEAAVLRLRFGIGGEELTLDEVGKRFSVTRERIRQIEVKALAHFEKALRGVVIREQPAKLPSLPRMLVVHEGQTNLVGEALMTIKRLFVQDWKRARQTSIPDGWEWVLEWTHISHDSPEERDNGKVEVKEVTFSKFRLEFLVEDAMGQHSCSVVLPPKGFFSSSSEVVQELSGRFGSAKITDDCETLETATLEVLLNPTTDACRDLVDELRDTANMDGELEVREMKTAIRNSMASNGKKVTSRMIKEIIDKLVESAVLEVVFMPEESDMKDLAIYRVSMEEETP